MTRERTCGIVAVWCLAVIGSDATFAAQTTKAVRGLKREGTALLQVNSAEAQQHGVTPDFFEEASLESGGNFEPKATNPENVIAGVQTNAVTAPAGSPPAAISKAVAGGGAAVYDSADPLVDHGMRLMAKATPAPPKLLIVQLHEAASEAHKVFTLFSARARTAMHNAAPSLFVKPGGTLQASTAARPGAHSERANFSNAKTQLGEVGAVGLAEMSTNASSTVAERGTKQTDSNASPPRLGAMNFFSGAQQLTDAKRLKPSPPVEHPSMMSIGAAKASTEETSAYSYKFPEGQDRSVSRAIPVESQQEWLKRKQADEMREAELLERQTESNLEDSMGSIRQLR